MAITSSTANLAQAIDALSQNLSVIASILTDAQTAADAKTEVAETQTPAKKKSPSKTIAKEQKDTQSAEASGAESSDSSVKVTVEDVRAVLAEKSQDGLTAKVRELLESFGAKKLSAVDPDRLPELLEAAKALQ